MSTSLNFSNVADSLCTIAAPPPHRRRINTEEEKTKDVVAAWWTDLIQFLVALVILHQDDLKKRMNKITATWRNGCCEKMAAHHTKPPP